MKTLGFAATDADTPLASFTFERRAPRANDVAIDILYAGVCHSDLHMTRNDWGFAAYPCVPGHEIVGRVSAVGRDVTGFKPGDSVAIGTLVDSCRACDQCRNMEEQYCRKGVTQTYNSPDPISGGMTYGGYSNHIVVREEFVLRLPEGLDPARAAPLLCAGITTYSPLKTWKVGPGTRVGVAGLGGLGHMAVKLAVGLGAEVTVITRSEGKRQDALALGAKGVLLSGAPEAMAAAANGFDFIIDTIPVDHDLAPLLGLLDIDATLVIVGQLGMLQSYNTLPLVAGRRRISGSGVGGIAETQRMLDFCAEKNILPDCEIIRMDEINAAFKRVESGDVRYRFVVDMATLGDAA